jgi:exosortase F-associated protein
MPTNTFYRIAIGSIFLLLLILIRFYEKELFYDPLLYYYKSDYLWMPYPEMSNSKLGLHLFFRYSLNSICSLVVIYCFYKNLNWVKFSAYLYFCFSIVLIISFYSVLFYFDDSNKMVLFYIRRFLIQPLFLLLFLVGFYYQKKMKSE